MFTLPLTTELIAGFAAVTVHASRDAVTPVLTHVRIDHRNITATQRYTHPDLLAEATDEARGTLAKLAAHNLTA